VGSRIEEITENMRRNPAGIRFKDLCRVCDHFFGTARQRGTSHRIYEVPVAGLPPVNIQSDRGMAKGYQVRQVLKAIRLLEEKDDS